MPLYLYKCPTCESVREDIRCIAQRNEGPVCTHTATPVRSERPVKMELQLSPVKGFVKNPAA